MSISKSALTLKPSSSILIDHLIKNLDNHPLKIDPKIVIKAYEFAKKAHQGQKRKSGEPYITHPLSVAAILIDLKMDQESIITALLHDVVEDTNANLKDIEKTFVPP